MATKIIQFFQMFGSGLGFRVLLSYMPPIAVAWVFFILYLNGLRQTDPETFRLALVLGLAGIAVGSVIVIFLIMAIVPPLRNTKYEILNTKYDFLQIGIKMEKEQLHEKIKNQY